MFTLENFYQSKQWIRFRDILSAIAKAVETDTNEDMR